MSSFRVRKTIPCQNLSDLASKDFDTDFRRSHSGTCNSGKKDECTGDAPIDAAQDLQQPRAPNGVCASTGDRADDAAFRFFHFLNLKKN